MVDLLLATGRFFGVLLVIGAVMGVVGAWQEILEVARDAIHSFIHRGEH